MTKPTKVFVVGFHRTGTTSTTRALRTLGFRLASPVVPLNRSLAETTGDPLPLIEATLREMADGADGLQDSPTAHFVEFLDAAYPGARFVLTTRSTESWMESYRRFFPDRNNPLRRWMYGVDRLSGHEDRYRAIYEARNAATRAHFAQRPGDFLEMDLTRGDGWNELCAFLGREAAGPFPHKRASRG